jgi:hypothetical protein
MNATQRLRAAVSGGVPDRVPVVPKIWVDLAARLTGTALSEVITDPLTALRVIAQAGRLCRVDAVRQFHLPARRLQSEGERVFEMSGRGEVLGEIDLAGGLGTHLRDPAVFDLADPRRVAYAQHWLADVPLVRDLDDARRLAVPGRDLYEELGCGERQRRVLEELGGETAVIGDCGAATMAFLVSMRGMNRAMFDLIEQPRLVHAIMDKGAAIAIEKGMFNLALGIQVLRLNDSVGNMSVISPEHWRQFVFPHMKEVCDTLHAHDPQARIYCHICGNVLPVVEDLVRTGLDCIGPLDPLGGFTPAQVRERVGDAVALMGGVNTLSFLNGTPVDIQEEAVRCLRQAGAHGGYVLSSGCVIPRESPRENLLALRMAAERYGVYKGGSLS